MWPTKTEMSVRVSHLSISQYDSIIILNIFIPARLCNRIQKAKANVVVKFLASNYLMALPPKGAGNLYAVLLS